MANVGNLDTKLKITVDPETGKITSVITELKGVKKANDDTTGSIIKGLAVWSALQKAVGFAFDAFKEGAHEMQETEEATRRMQVVATQTGASMDEMNKAAAELAKEGLIQMDEAMQRVNDLVQTGFSTTQIDAMIPALKNVAAAAGGDVATNIETMTSAFVKGRVSGEEMAKMLPSLKENMKTAGLSMADMADETKAAQVQQVLYASILQDGQAAVGAYEDKLFSASGQMKVMENAAIDLKEEFATGLINAMTDGADATGDMKAKMDELKPAVGELGKAIGSLITLLLKIPGAVKDASTAFGEWLDKNKIFRKSTDDSGEGMAQLTVHSKLLATSVYEGRTASLSAAEANIKYASSFDPWKKAAEDVAKAAGTTLPANLKKSEAELKAHEAAAKKAATELENLAKAEEKFKISERVAQMKALNDVYKTNADRLKDINDAILAEAQAYSTARKAAEENLTNAVLDAALKRKQDEEDAIKEVAEYEKQQYEERKQMASDFFAFLDNLFGNMLRGGAHAIIGLTQIFTTQWKQMKSQIGEGWDFITGSKSSGAGRFTDIVSGFGQIASAIGPVIGLAKQLFSALKELFAHDYGKDVTNLESQFGFFGFTEDLIKKLTDAAKKYKDAGTAFFMNLDSIIGEQGVTQGNFNSLIQTMLYGWTAMDQGRISAQELASTIATVFPQMADAAIEFGGAFIDQLGQVIAKMKETGVGMDTLQSYFDQLQAKIDEIRGEALTDLISQVSGLGDAFAQMMEKMKAKGQAAGGNETNWATFLSASDLTQSKNRFDEMERYFTETVAAMKAQGMSMADIFKQLGPLWDQLAQAAKDFGFETSKEFQDLSRTMELMKRFQAAFAKLDFISNIAKDEARLGVLTQKTFEDLEQNVFATFKRMADMSREQILAAAKSGKPLTDQAQDALKATLPYLIQVIGMHNQMGLAISKNDQAMIKLAQDMGLLPDDLSAVGIDPTLAALDKMLQVLVLIAEALGVDADAIAGIGDAMDSTADAWNAAINRMLPFPIPGNHDYNPDYHRLPRPGDDPFVTSGNTVRSGDTHLHIHVPPGVVRNEYELARFVGNEIDKKNRQNRQ